MENLNTNCALQKNAVLPTRARTNDVGYDLTVLSISRADKAHPNTQTFMVDFGVSVEPPPGYYFELIARSSLAWTGFILPNAIGVIDPDYRGTLKMPLLYLGLAEQADEQAESLVGCRLAQLVLRPLLSCQFTEVQAQELSTTHRGQQGFGSSGL